MNVGLDAMSYLNMTTANAQQTLKLGDMQTLNTNFEVTVPCSNNPLILGT